MIISASRRTDIPAFYNEWFMNRLREKKVYVRNPMNIYQVSEIPLDKSVVDCIVFWTKNPTNLMKYLDEIDEMGYKYYFQFTLNPYDKKMELGLPDKEYLMDVFCKLSSRLGKESVVWRYDPIILNDYIDINYHIDNFEKMSKKLSGYTSECIISFVDLYKKVERNMKAQIRNISIDEMNEIAKAFSKIAQDNKLELKTCAEKIDFDRYGIKHASCIDGEKIESIINAKLKNLKKDGQREACGCVECIDIGAYDTCSHGCSYCYATRNAEQIRKNMAMHNPQSKLLIGEIGENDKVNVRQVKSFIESQTSLFDL